MLSNLRSQGKLTRDKIATGHYYLLRSDGLVVAECVKTGTRRDNYPWDWYLYKGLQFRDNIARSSGVADSLASCVDIVQGRMNKYGLEFA